MAKSKKDAEPAKVGRPTKYKPEYCEMLIEHMSQGYSYETFGAVVDCSKQTVYDWEEHFPEFVDAKKRAFTKCQQFWEKLGIDNIISRSSREYGSETLNTGVWVFNMKNRFKWTDRVEVIEKEEQPIKLAYDPSFKDEK